MKDQTNRRLRRRDVLKGGLAGLLGVGAFQLSGGTAYAAPSITTPSHGATVSGTNLVISGSRQYSGSTVTVQITDELHNQQKDATVNGTNWTVTFASVTPAGFWIVNVMESYMGNQSLVTIGITVT